MRDPQKRVVVADVLAPAGYGTRSLTSGRLESAAVAGFRLDAEWLWRRPLPSTVACFRQILPGA
ncbi:MAG TPA: hypothetical protein VLI67_02800 [Vicinamibacteria bacterium]|nr:hypothetical protein [Vicinamibacteria bacterium]